MREGQGMYASQPLDTDLSLRAIGAFANNAFAASLLDPATQATLCAEVDHAIA